VDPESVETRRLSAAAFGSEKLVEIVLACEAERPGAIPLKDLAEHTAVPRSLLNPVLSRLVDVGALRQLPRVGGTRAPVHFEGADEFPWERLVSLCRQLTLRAKALTHPAGAEF
jgi:hypothetical protein